MQAIQSLAGSLQENASVQKLRESIMEIPKMIAQVGQTEPEDVLLGTTSGEYNFHFTFRLEGGGFFQTGVLVASALSRVGGMPLPLKCRWKRRVGELWVEIPGITSNMYQISADDVGTEIRVEAEPADGEDGFHGVAISQIGPFELDPSTRRKLDDAIGSGSTRFSVSQWRSPASEPSTPTSSASSRQDLRIHMQTEGLRIVPVQGGVEQTKREVCAQFTLDYPRVIIHPLETCKFQLVTESRTFNLQASNRTTRDVIATTIRCFHARRFMGAQPLLDELFPSTNSSPGVGSAPGCGGAGPDARAAAMATNASDGRLDVCILLERLTKELNRSMSQKERLDKYVRNTNREALHLQAQLSETISGYTDVIENLQSQCSGHASDGSASGVGGMSEERLQEQLRHIHKQNQALQTEINATKQRAEEAQKAREGAVAAAAAAAPPPPGSEAANLLEERSMLQSRLESLKVNSGSIGQQSEEVGQDHVKEVKRLRQDVESLHDTKEGLRRHLGNLDREREELQQNFLYVKGQLDKVQMRQATAGPGAYDGTQELQKLEHNLGSLKEERSRLGQRVENLTRELEKEKTHHEASLERVMTANGRLMEEKDRATKEVQRIGQLYADAVKTLQQTSSGPSASAGAAVAAATSGDDEEEIRRLQAQIAQADESILQKDQENESLKNRIRKLAVAP